MLQIILILFIIVYLSNRDFLKGIWSRVVHLFNLFFIDETQAGKMFLNDERIMKKLLF
jgi:hypothetical protein